MSQNSSLASLNHSFEEALEKVKEISIRQDYPFNIVQESDLTLLHDVKLDVAKLALDKIHNYLSVIEGARNQVVTPFLEVKFLKDFMARINVFSHCDWEHLIKFRQVIELHSLEGIQLYRNLEMFKYSSYSLIQLLVIPWDDLYSRPDKAARDMNQSVGMCLESPTKAQINTIPKHVVIEKYATKGLTVELDFEAVWPVYDRQTNEPHGVISTKTCRKILNKESSDNLRCLQQ